MRIALITPGFSANEADWCIPAVQDLARKLAEAHDVTVYTLRYPHIQSVYTVYGAKVRAFGAAEASGLRRIPLMMRVRRAIRAAHKREPFDILHALWADEPGYIATTLAPRLSVPALVSILGGELVNLPQIGYGHQRSRFARWAVRQSLADADAVTVGSRLLLRQASRYVAPDRLTLAPLGVDDALFRQDDETLIEGDLRLLQVGALSPVKNHRLTLEALALVSQSLDGVRLDIVGDGPERAALMTFAERLGVADRVVFHGELRHERLPEFYRAADLCLLTSYVESQSMAALEAAACGRATIGAHVGLLPELVGSEYTATSLNADYLSRLIIELARDRDRLGALNAAAAARVREGYLLEQSVERWLKIYQRIREES